MNLFSLQTGLALFGSLFSDFSTKITEFLMDVQRILIRKSKRALRCRVS